MLYVFCFDWSYYVQCKSRVGKGDNMNMISSYLLSIAGIIVLCVLAQLIIPEGQINKYVKVIFSFIILLVIAMPLPKIVKTEFDIGNLLNFETTLQEDYLKQLNLDKLNALTEQLNKKIKDEKIENVVVTISSDIFKEDLVIFGVYVDIRKMKCETDKESAKEKITEIVKSFEKLQNVEVMFDE